MVVEFIGTFFLMWVIVGVAVNPRGAKDWAGLRDRRHAGPRGDGARAAHRRRLQPGARVRPGAGRATAFNGGGDFLLVYVLGAGARRRSLAALAYFSLYITPGKKEPGGMEPVG